MKIGIFISGEIRGSDQSLRNNIQFLSEGFDGVDTIFGIWNTQKDQYVSLQEELANKHYVDVPYIHYHPYKDNPDYLDDYQYQKKLANPNPRHEHQTKQILVHNELMKTEGKKYDIIVRARWDTTISPFINYVPYAREVWTTPCTMSMSTRHDWANSIHIVSQCMTSEEPYSFHNLNNPRRTKNPKMFNDSGIILHRSQDWDCELVDRLHRDKKLLAAEFGWYQILGENKRWKQYDGGASITRSLIREDREKINEILCYNN